MKLDLAWGAALPAAIALLAAACLPHSAMAQSYFGGNDGGMGRWHGVMPTPGPYRPINLSPTGRPYSAEAPTYLPKHRVPKRKVR
jgi:hypothetical protein